MFNEIVYDPSREEPRRVRMQKDAAFEFHVDFNYWAVREGGALSSAVWLVKEGSITIGADTEASNITMALVTADAEGLALIEITATLDSAGASQIGIQYIHVLIPVTETKRGIKY